MSGPDYLVEMKPVLVAQRHLLLQAGAALDGAEAALRKSDAHACEIAELKKIVEELEENRDFVTDVIEAYDDQAVQQAIEEKKALFSTELKNIRYENWPQFVRDSQIYCLTNNLDYLLPFDAFLEPQDLEQLKSEEYGRQYQWDKWDYLFVGSAGILAALSDYFLVGIPKQMSYMGGGERPASPLSSFVKGTIKSDGDKETWFRTFARKMEKRCKVPYDAAHSFSGMEGMFPRSHRLQSLGHDPLLGLIVGVLDIYRGSFTGFSYDKLSGLHTLRSVPAPGDWDPISLLEAFLKQLGHLVSDAGTAQGVPPPFFSLLQGMNVEDPLSPKGRTVGQIARWMYLNGYDFRHFLVSGVTPAVIEIILRAYLMIRHYSEKGEVKFVLADNPKYRSMLLSAHAIAAAGNAGKIALHQGNPLAINYAEWLALLRYLLPSLKYWLFDKRRLRLEHYRKINDDAWEELAKSGSLLLQRVMEDHLEVAALGQGLRNEKGRSQSPPVSHSTQGV